MLGRPDKTVTLCDKESINYCWKTERGKSHNTHKTFYKDTVYRKECLAGQQHFILHEEHVTHDRIVMIGKAQSSSGIILIDFTSVHRSARYVSKPYEEKRLVTCFC